MKSKKILIIGATGFVGSHLVNRLLSDNHEVISFSTSNSLRKGIEHIQGDLRDESTTLQAIRKLPDIVILAGGISGQVNSDSNLQVSNDVNVVGHKRLLDQIINLIPRSRIIFISSRLEYGVPKYLPVNENHPLQPLSAYGKQKKAISEYLTYLNAKHNLAATIFRVSNFYGPHNPQKHSYYNVVNYFIDKALNDKELLIYGDGKQLRDYLYIGDFLDLISSSCGTKDISGVYNVGLGKSIPFAEMASIIIETIGKGSLRFVPWSAKDQAVETGDFIYDISKIVNHLNWEPKTDFCNGVIKTIK